MLAKEVGMKRKSQAVDTDKLSVFQIVTFKPHFNVSSPMRESDTSVHKQGWYLRRHQDRCHVSRAWTYM